MQASFQITEDSHSLIQYFKPNKRDIIREKKQIKQIQSRTNPRKNSTQLSLFDWLVKPRSKQTCALTRLPKNLIMNIFSYFRISDIGLISQSCFYFYECARSIWNDSEFFKELQTDKLSEGQLRNILEKGGKMGHVKQLRNIYMGKNLKTCRQKIKVKIHETGNNNLRPLLGNLLQVFQVSTKMNKPSAFLMDNHLQQIINSSYRSLLTIKLQSCRFIRKFYDISKCTQLISLTITQNSNITNEDMRLITKYCSKLEHLNLSGCDNLDQGIFKHISKLLSLKTLSFNSYQQPFGDLQCMKFMTCLEQVNIENSCILDNQGIQLVRQLQSIKFINIAGCQLLTDFFLDSVISMSKHQYIEIKLHKTKFSQSVLQQWRKYNDKNTAIKPNIQRIKQ